VPFPHPRDARCLSGLSAALGFITMNLDRHTDAHKALFSNLVKATASGRQARDF